MTRARGQTRRFFLWGVSIRNSLRSNNTPTNHTKKVAKNNRFVLGEHILYNNSAPIFNLRLRRRQNSCPKKILRLTRRQKQWPNSFYEYDEDEKNYPTFFFAFGDFNAATIPAPAAPECCGKPMLRQAAHRLRQVLPEMAISTRMLRQRNSATAN